MSVAERDKYSGHMTTGHEWNGIKELNTPLPVVLLIFLFAVILFSVGYWIVMPAWPLGNSYTRGTSGFDQRDHLAKQLLESKHSRAQWTDTIEQSSFATIASSERLMQIVDESGPALYNDNCAMCHGVTGEGSDFFPRLKDQTWLWGSQPESILQTLTVGINSHHKDTRVAIMPGFGDAGVLDENSITAIVQYVRSIAGERADQNANNKADTTAAVSQFGATQYATYCAGCHGASGAGNTAVGGPRLDDKVWIYGGDGDSLRATIRHGRQGHMPAWEDRLSLSERKILVLYILGLNDTDASAKP